MNLSRFISIILIVTGGIIAFYAQSETSQNQYILVLGIFLLMVGLYRISRNIPSKYEEETPKDNSDEF